MPSKEDMKRKITVCAVLGALGCSGILAAGQGGLLHMGSSQALIPPWPGNAQTNIQVIPFAGTNRPFRPLPPGHKPETQIQILPPSAQPGSPPAPTTIPPGVYRTVPYSCIVVVPGPHPDDRCVVKPGNVDSSMPIIKPELRFIPWKPTE